MIGEKDQSTDSLVDRKHANIWSEGKKASKITKS